MTKEKKNVKIAPPVAKIKGRMGAKTDEKKEKERKITIVRIKK